MLRENEFREYGKRGWDFRLGYTSQGEICFTARPHTERLVAYNRATGESFSFECESAQQIRFWTKAMIDMFDSLNDRKHNLLCDIGQEFI